MADRAQQALVAEEEKREGFASHPTPCALHFTPYTLHPTAYSLHPKP